MVKLIDNDDVSIGDVVIAKPRLQKLHFFDAETEVNLLSKDPQGTPSTEDTNE